MRLDVALVERGLARSRSQAARLIGGGLVSIDGIVVTKASTPVPTTAELSAESDHWVSRAAHKLLGALDDSQTLVPERVLDAGASTGGFTQVCLERGASAVVAIDVGHGQLAPMLRTDPRVTVHEGLNLRDLTLAQLGGEAVDLIVGDVSFISLRLLLAPLLGTVKPSGQALLLVKPQFEVGRHGLGAGGIVTDPVLRREAVAGVLQRADELGWRCDWQGESRLPGSGGNVEFFVRLTR